MDYETSETERKFLDYIFDGLTMHEAAEEVGFSPSEASDVVDKAIDMRFLRRFCQRAYESIKADHGQSKSKESDGMDITEYKRLVVELLKT